MNDKLAILWKDAGLAFCVVLSRHFPEETVENYEHFCQEIRCSGMVSNRAPPEIYLTRFEI
jgi:hypothetical protein